MAWTFSSKRPWTWAAAAVAALGVLALLPQGLSPYGPLLRGGVAALLRPVSWPLATVGARLRQQVHRPPLAPADQMGEELRYKDGRIIAMEKQVRDLQRQLTHLQGLQRTLGDSYVFRRAEVIGRDAGGAGATFQIALGARDGLEEGLAVLEEAPAAGAPGDPVVRRTLPNLVGRVIQVGFASSVVEPVTAGGNLLEVVFAPPRLEADGLPPQRQRTCLLRGAGGRILAAAEVDRALPVEVGDLARLRDDAGPGRWPDAAQGMVVGEVVSVEDSPDDPLRKRVEVRPPADPAWLEAVTVILPRRSDEPPAPRPGASP